MHRLAMLLALGASGCSERAQVETAGVLAHDGRAFYWAESVDDTVQRSLPDGGSETWWADAGAQGPVWATSTSLYWNRVSGSWRRSLDGGDLVPISARSILALHEDALLMPPAVQLANGEFWTPRYLGEDGGQQGYPLGFLGAEVVLGTCEYDQARLGDPYETWPETLRAVTKIGESRVLARGLCPFSSRETSMGLLVGDYAGWLLVSDAGVRVLKLPGLLEPISFAGPVLISGGVAWYQYSDGGTVGDLVAAPLDGGKFVNIASSAGGLEGLATDGVRIYWLAAPRRFLRSAPIPVELR